MPSTTNFGWTTPADTDLVKDGASAIRTLGNGIDTTLVDLKGGTTGQVLSKNSNTDMDFTWVAQDDSNAIQNALLTTTGDTIYASSASTPARLGIGTAGQVLTVSAGGIPSWATSSAVAPSLVPQISGYFLGTPSTGSSGAENATLNMTYFTPVYLSGINFDRIVIRAANTFSGTATVRLGIYNSNNSTGKPSTVYLDAGTVALSLANTDYTITINSTPPAGYYWLAANAQAISGTCALTSMSSGSNTIANEISSNTTSTNRSAYWTESGITGAFATAGTLTTSIAVPRPLLRMA